MKKIAVVFALLGTMLIPQLAVANGDKDCDAKSIECDLVKKGVARKVIPNPDLVCIYFVQPKPSNVLLWVFLPGQRDPRPYVKRNAGTSGSFCIGRHYVRDAEALYMCNVFDGHAVYPRADAVAVALKEKLARMPGEACLYGEGECERKGYKPVRALSDDEKKRMEELRKKITPLVAARIK